jgi:Uma2 family endonuclease
MTFPSYPLPQRDPPLPPRENLPTMYDLPSEDPEEPGSRGEYHDLQPQLLSRTFRTSYYSFDNLFMGTDINLYYDVRYPLRYKRPDWFVVLGVPRLYDRVDLRSSYVIWQEGIDPFVVVELLSPGTEKEDLGQDIASELENSSNGQISETPPRKWEVYERILRIPYYVVFSRYTDEIHFFKLVGGRYQELVLDADEPKAWLPEIEIGLGLWFGEFEGIERLWLRWYDSQGNWIPTDTEQERQRAERERQRAEQAELQLQQIVLNLKQSGLTIEQIANLTGLSEEAIGRILESLNQ